MKIFTSLSPSIPRPIHWQIGVFRPSQASRLTSLRAWMVSLVLRVALRLRFVVLLIGVARSGKTYLLERTTPGKIIDESQYWRYAANSPLFNLSTVPDGFFAIDESTTFESASLFESIKRMKDRSFVVSAQRYEDALHIGTALKGRRILVLHLK